MSAREEEAREARITRKAAGGEVVGVKHADGLSVRNAPHAETLDYLHHRPPSDLLQDERKSKK